MDHRASAERLFQMSGVHTQQVTASFLYMHAFFEAEGYFLAGRCLIAQVVEDHGAS